MFRPVNNIIFVVFLCSTQILLALFITLLRVTSCAARPAKTTVELPPLTPPLKGETHSNITLKVRQKLLDEHSKHSNATDNGLCVDNDQYCRDGRPVVVTKARADFNCSLARIVCCRFVNGTGVQTIPAYYAKPVPALAETIDFEQCQCREVQHEYMYLKKGQKDRHWKIVFGLVPTGYHCLVRTPECLRFEC